ncbi:MAG: amidohydrolase family protein [Solirubrobacterales bacterium]|nr:amidohydrolase family protein [Solirubrobacterales bacterium]
MRIDVHQHIWTEPLRRALEARNELPLIRVQNGLSILHCQGEHPYVIDTESETPTARTELLDQDGLDSAVIAISSPIGIEALRRDQAIPLLDAHLSGVAELGPRFKAWGPLPTDRTQPADVDPLAAKGCAGISLSAGALASPDQADALRPTLRRIAELGLPLFIHPGRAHGDRINHPALDEPFWWPALNDYTSQMQTAWLTWATHARRDHPELITVFAMLAGLAPLQHERLSSRGGPVIDLQDPNTYYDSSSYGPELVGTLANTVGTDQLLYGSDRPVLEPQSCGRDAALQRNADTLFAPVPSTARIAA